MSPVVFGFPTVYLSVHGVLKAMWCGGGQGLWCCRVGGDGWVMWRCCREQRLVKTDLRWFCWVFIAAEEARRRRGLPPSPELSGVILTLDLGVTLLYCTAVQQYSITAVQGHCCTVSLLYSITAVQGHQHWAKKGVFRANKVPMSTLDKSLKGQRRLHFTAAAVQYNRLVRLEESFTGA